MACEAPATLIDVLTPNVRICPLSEYGVDPSTLRLFSVMGAFATGVNVAPEASKTRLAPPPGAMPPTQLPAVVQLLFPPKPLQVWAADGRGVAARMSRQAEAAARMRVRQSDAT